MNWKFIFLSYFSLFCIGLIENARGPAYPEMLEFFNVSTTFGSLIFTSASLFGVITSAASSIWLPRLGPILSGKLFLLVMALSCFGMGLSGYNSEMFWPVLICSSFFGISLGGSGVVLNILIPWGSPEKLRRKAFSGLHSMYGIASFSVPIFVGFSTKLGLLWNECFIVLSIIPFIGFLFSYKIQSDRTFQKASSFENKKFFFASFLVVLAFAFYVSSEILISSRLVYYLLTFLKFGKEEASIYLSIFFFLLLTGRLVFTFFHFNISNFKLLLISIFFTFFLFLYGLFINPIGLSLCGLSMSFFFPCGMDWINEIFGNQSEKVTYRTMTGIGIFLFIMHFTVGTISDIYNIRNAMFLGIIFIVLTFLMLVSAAKLVRRVKNE